MTPELAAVLADAARHSAPKKGTPEHAALLEKARADYLAAETRAARRELAQAAYHFGANPEYAINGHHDLEHVAKAVKIAGVQVRHEMRKGRPVTVVQLPLDRAEELLNVRFRRERRDVETQVLTASTATTASTRRAVVRSSLGRPAGTRRRRTAGTRGSPARPSGDDPPPEPSDLHVIAPSAFRAEVEAVLGGVS